MWNLESEKDGKRLYRNSITNSQCVTTKLYQDREGNDWYGFDNLTEIPYTRNFAATKISSLYALGLSKTDLTNHIEGLKKILKSDDREKYEKAYSLVLDFESKANNATDAIRQMSSLVCVYYMLNDERIDSFEQSLQLHKMSLLEADPKAHAFFLNQQIKDIERYTTFLNQISRIASVQMPELSNLSQ